MDKFTTTHSDKCKLFRETFKDIPGITTDESEWVDGREGMYGVPDVIKNQDCGDFRGSAYIDRIEFVAVYGNSKEGYEVFINNPNCEIDEKGCAIFTEEHPQQQWVFGRYSSFKRAVNKAVSIIKARKYPKPIEIYKYPQRI